MEPLSQPQRNIEDIYPLSPMQEGMLFHSLFTPESRMYFEQMSCSLRGALHIDAFTRAWQTVIQRHSILRTGFLWEETEQPLQVVFKSVDFQIERMDWQNYPASEQKSKLLDLLRADISQGFNLAEPPLMRIYLIQTAIDTYNFVWSHHHLLLDGWSSPLLLKEVFSSYEAFSQGLPVNLGPAIPYRNYIAWLKQQSLQQAEATWREVLKGFTAPTPLVVDTLKKSKAHLQAGPGFETSFEAEAPVLKGHLSAEASQALRNLTMRQQITLSTLAQGAWALLLHRYCGERDIVFGTTVSGRPPDIAGVENIVGLFINTLPVRVDIDPDMPLVDWLRGLQARQAFLRQYEYTPLVRIQEWSEAPRGQPLFESILVFENYPVDDSLREQGGSLQIQDVRHYSRTNYPITLVVSPGSTIGLEVAYDGQRFDEPTIQRLLGHYTTLLENIAANSDRPVGQFSILPEAERRQILVDWNGQPAPLPEDCLVHRLFEKQAAQTPAALAVQFLPTGSEATGSQILTYQELNQRAERLARYLKSLGVGPGRLVAIFIERSPEMIVALLAVLKAGGAYLPVDPTYPAERVAYMLEDAGRGMPLPVLLSQARLLDRLPPFTGQVVSLDLEIPAVEGVELPDHAATPSDLAYVIYTSGSTGAPKGVMISHRALVNLALNAVKTMEIRPSDRVLQYISLSFDASGEEIYPALFTGAALLLPESSREISGSDLLRYCDRQAVTILHLPAAVWHQCVEELVVNQRAGLSGGVPASLRLVLVGGESPSIEKLRQWISLGGDRQVFVNSYGPTETTISATNYRLHLGEDPVPDMLPIGRPLANVQVYVVDERDELVPVGVSGELLIGGEGVARGYLNRIELTHEKFISNPFGAGRVYRTGDRARYLPDGNLEFLGRLDEQVKLRGYRIELGEIEHAMKDLKAADGQPLLADAAVVLREDEPGNKRLTAYVVAAVEQLNHQELRTALAIHLPDYMLPAMLVSLPALPLTPGGKVNRKALLGLPAPELSHAVQTQELVSPRSAIEEIVAGLWIEVLGLDGGLKAADQPINLSVHANFFETGGHSLKATQLVSRLRQVFQVDISLRSLFDAPTIAGMSAILESVIHQDEILTGSRVQSPPITRVARDPVTGLPLQPAPMSFSQQRLWFLDQLDPGNLSYNIPAVVKITGALDVAALEKALNQVVARHEALRTIFELQGSLPVQVVLPEVIISLPENDLRSLPADELERIIQSMASQVIHQSFDLARGPLLRGQVLHTRDEEFVLVIVVHHIVADGWSLGVFIRELVGYYQEKHSQLEPMQFRPADLPVQYSDYAAWQRNWLQGETLEHLLAYWKKQLAGMPPLLDLPTDRPRPAIKTANGATLSLQLTADLSEALLNLCRLEGVTPYMLLLAAYQTILYRYSGQTDISVGTAVANRTRVEIEGLIGFFVNNLVMRTDLSGEPSFRETLRRVREVALGAYAHQDMPFENLVEALQPARNLSYTPLFQVGFDYQETSRSQQLLATSDQLLEFHALDLQSGVAQFDLLLSMTRTAQGLSGSLDYNTDLYDAATMHRFLGHFQTLLHSAVQDPDQAISKLPILPEPERRQLLVDWNQTQAPFPPEPTIFHRFESQVNQHPDQLALVFNQQSLSYRELNQRANQVARYLLGLGVKPDSIVGIAVERSLDMVIGILGILKSGAAYLPLDPHYPAERLAFMLEDSGIPILLTQAPLLEWLPLQGRTGLQVVCLDRDWAGIEQAAQGDLDTNPASQLPLAQRPGPDHLAYVIYTSGSTGKPKGTLLRHRGLVNLAEAQRKAFTIQAGSRVLQFAPLSFDASVWETFMALANGGVLVLARQETLASVPDLLALLRDQEVTTVTLPPSLLSIVPAEQVTARALPALKTVIAAGERCTQEIVQRWADANSGRQFFNAYGPTETTVCASWALVDETQAGDPPIGRPLPNIRLYVLDQYKQPVPIGIPGELYVGGAAVARGYLNRPELTDDKFISDIFADSNRIPMHHAAQAAPAASQRIPARGAASQARLYRTGDLVRYRVDGNIEFLGRVDEQVKVRGFRIELGEIEAVLRQYVDPQGFPLKESTVVVREDIAGDKRLVAYLTPHAAPVGTDAAQTQEASALYIDHLRNYLRQALPDYMVPSAFVFLEALPISPAGKIDKRALVQMAAPQALRQQVMSEYVAPRTPLELELARLCAALLNIAWVEEKPPVGVNDNFFELGGHSLLATQFISRIREVYKVELPLRTLFEHPTVAGLAMEIEQLQLSGARPQAPAIQAVSRDARRMKRTDIPGSSTSVPTSENSSVDGKST